MHPHPYFRRLFSNISGRPKDMRKAAFYICENKDADQLRGTREADQCLCFRYTDSTIPLLPMHQSFVSPAPLGLGT